MARRTESPEETAKLDIIRQYPQVGVLLNWFDVGHHMDRPATESPFGLLSHYLGREAMHVEDAFPIATALVMELVGYAERTDSLRRQDAARAALAGDVITATTAMSKLPGSLLPANEDQVLGIAHLVAAINEGHLVTQGAGYNFYAADTPGRDHLKAGMIHLAQVLPLRRPVPPRG